MAFVLSQLLSDAAFRYPEQVAVSCAGRKLTYAALEEESNRLAHFLCKERIGRGDRVGIFLNKSVETVLGIFAILKTGAAYVPLDPLAPARRVGFIIQNCGIRCLLTKRAKLEILTNVLSEPGPVELVLLMDDETVSSPANHGERRYRSRWEAKEESKVAPEISTVDQDLGYILYTSGSTGNPKGVMISHLNALTFIEWAYRYYGIQATDRLSNHAPFHFDLSIFDLFVGIKAGATIHLVPESIAWFPTDMVRFIAEHRITVWYSVPSALSLMVLHGGLKDTQFPDLRWVLFAGEVFPIKYLRSLMEFWPGAQFSNLYGPTETNVCTYYTVAEVPGDSTPLPIGKACANTEVFALNDENRRTVAGEVGELYVRGSSIMKGYWGLPEKTAQVVVESKDASGHDERIYRTGDLVLLEEDGNYRFLGRRDHMVKSRGYRIELGEVEAALYNHPQIKEAAVLALPDDLIGNRLLAAVVSSKETSLTPAAVLQHCAQQIPKYMVPEAVEFRDFLPKTSTGKIDRQQLMRELTEKREAASR